MKAIVNAKLVLVDHYIPNGVIVFDNEKIISFGKKSEISVPKDAEIIDAKGLYVGPGLIDIHTHAADNKWIFSEPKATSEFMLKHGVTSVLPALYYNLNKQQYLDACDSIINAYKNGDFENFMGFYMEGPYLNPKFGCDREKNTWKGAIDKNDYLPLIDKAKDYAKVWCISPEREGIENFVYDVKKSIPNIVFTVAHSEASPEQIERFIPLGLRIGTHHTNATGTIEKYSECRGVCVDETVNYNKEIYAEIISDKMGLHVDPYMQRLVRKIKGDYRIILISDQFVGDGPIPKGYEECDDIHFDWAGEIAGSGLTLDIACRNFINHTGCSICDAFKFASYNPACALGVIDYGSIRVGNKPNLIIVDEEFNVKKVINKGKVVND
ncbi:MAG: amidohydrolase family protein [Clostridia bacterium]|nr:amidohydrolase family protein [Clostridia bacterium]